MIRQSVSSVFLGVVLSTLVHGAAAQSASAPASDTGQSQVPVQSEPRLQSYPVTGKGSYLQRRDVRDFIADLNTRLGLPREEIEAALAQVEPIPQVIELIKPAASPLVRSWKRYRSRFLDAIRINNGRRFMETHATTLKAAEAQYGVPKEIIAAIIGVETVYGRNTGNFNTVAALSTLAFDYPPRAPLFRRELEALFLLAHERGVNPLDYKGSYAGAIGLPQFLPSSIRAFAVDFDDDGKIDLRNDPVDAIGSVGRYLAENGWQRGKRIVLDVQIPTTLDTAPLVAAGMRPSFAPEALRGLGITPAAPLEPEEMSAVIDLVTPGEATAYKLGLQNFYVITRYNLSSFYAMAVNDLAEELARPTPTRKTAPTHHR